MESENKYLSSGVKLYFIGGLIGMCLIPIIYKPKEFIIFPLTPFSSNEILVLNNGTQINMNCNGYYVTSNDIQNTYRKISTNEYKNINSSNNILIDTTAPNTLKMLKIKGIEATLSEAPIVEKIRCESKGESK